MSEREWKPGQLAMMTWDCNVGGPFAVVRGEGRWHMLDHIIRDSEDFLTDEWLKRSALVRKLLLGFWKSDGPDGDGGGDTDGWTRCMQEALRQIAKPPPEVYEHLLIDAIDDGRASLCGKVWTPASISGEVVNVVGRCPNCLDKLEGAWVS